MSWGSCVKMWPLGACEMKRRRRNEKWSEARLDEQASHSVVGLLPLPLAPHTSPRTRHTLPLFCMSAVCASKQSTSEVCVRAFCSATGGGMESSGRRHDHPPQRPQPAAGASEEEEWEDAPLPSTTVNDVGRAIVVAIPASRLARWLWARRRHLGTAGALAAGGPAFLGAGAGRLCVAAGVAALVPGGWRTLQALALVGAAPGVQVMGERESARESADAAKAKTLAGAKCGHVSFSATRCRPLALCSPLLYPLMPVQSRRGPPWCMRAQKNSLSRPLF